MINAKKKQMVLYVATNGRDKWSGKLPEPNQKKTDGPFATIVGARNAVRKLRKRRKTQMPARILIRGGEYHLKKPVTFTSEDSGSTKSPITYTAYPGEKPLISGGHQIRKWTETKIAGKKMWVTTAPGAREKNPELRELFVNGNRRRRARLPKKGFYKIAASTSMEASPYNTRENSFVFASGDIKQWKNLLDVEVVVLHYWAESHLKIRSVDTKKRIVSFQNESRRRFLTRQGGPTKYYVENVFESIEPGEWYFHKKRGKIYYMPLQGEELGNVNAVIPRLEALVRIEGKTSEGKCVEHIHFQNLCFAHVAVSFENIASSIQAAYEVPGAIRFKAAWNCSVQNCEIAHINTYGIELSNGCCGNHIVGNHIFDMGAGGIKLDGAATQANRHELTMNNIVSDNHIHHGGKISHSAVGILVCHSGRNAVSHNHIHDLYYTGISVGWTWGYSKNVVSTDNLIEYNHIHDIGHGWLSDMGGIYTLGLSTGTLLRCNLIHDVKCDIYGGWGIYFDEGTTNIVAEENIAYNCRTGGFHQHYGKDNIVRNNIFGPSKRCHCTRTREEEHTSFIFKRNIFYIKGGTFLDGNWLKPGYLFDENLYWRADGKKLRFSKWSFDEWQKRGQDLNSLVADPLFNEPGKGDFGLSPDSPAFALGFRPIDTSNIGVRNKAEG